MNMKAKLTTFATASAIALAIGGSAFAGTLEENKNIVQRYLDATFNQANFAMTDELVSANFLDHGNDRVDSRTREALKAGVVIFRETFPDLKVEITHILADGDLVSYRFVSTSAGFDGRPFKLTGTIIDRIENGQIVERWENFDEVGANEYFNQ